MDSRAICHGFAPQARSVPNWKARRFQRSDSQKLPSGSTTIRFTLPCMAEMTTNCYSPYLLEKQSSCRIPFVAYASQRLEELPENARCSSRIRTAERVRSRHAVGIPSGKSCRHGQSSEPDRKCRCPDWYNPPYRLRAILHLALNPSSRPITHFC